NDGIRDRNVTGVQTCALPIYSQTHVNGRGVLSHLVDVVRQACHASPSWRNLLRVRVVLTAANVVGRERCPLQTGSPAERRDSLHAGVEVPVLVDTGVHSELDGHSAEHAARIVQYDHALDVSVLLLRTLEALGGVHLNEGVTRVGVATQDEGGVTGNVVRVDADGCLSLLVPRRRRTGALPLAGALAHALVDLDLAAPLTGHSRSQAACGSPPSSDGRGECRGGTREGRTRPTSLRAT